MSEILIFVIFVLYVHPDLGVDLCGRFSHRDISGSLSGESDEPLVISRVLKICLQQAHVVSLFLGDIGFQREPG